MKITPMKKKIIGIIIIILFFFSLVYIGFVQQADKNLLIITLVLLSLFFNFSIILNSFFRIIPRINLPINKNTKILEKANISDKFLQNHNSVLISTLANYVAIDANEIFERNRIILQVRLFYAAILAGLVSYLYSNPKPLIALFILLLIIIMYLQEVHLEDLLRRSTICYFIKCKAVEQLINVKPRWYKLKYESLHKQQEKASRHRWRRKFSYACNPSIEQIIFYCIPWLGINLFYIYWIYLQK